MGFNKLVRTRASIRKYSSQKPPIEKVIDAIEAANLAPSPANLPILKYIIIEDSEKIEKIAQACQQRFIQNAPFVVVVCSAPKKVEIMYDKRADKYIKQHAGAAIENFLLKVTDLGLASCWIGAFSDETIKSLLRIPDNMNVESVLLVGYQSKIDKTTQKQKYKLDGRVYFETYGNIHKKPIRSAHPG